MKLCSRLYRYGKHVEADPELSNVGRRMRAEYEHQTRTLVDDVRHDAWQQFEAAHQLAPTAVMAYDPYMRGRRDAEAEIAGRERAAYEHGVRETRAAFAGEVDAVRVQERQAATVEFEERMAEIAERQEHEFTRVVEPHLEAALVRGFEEGRASGGAGEDSDVINLDDVGDTAMYVSPIHWYEGS